MKGEMPLEDLGIEVVSENVCSVCTGALVCNL